MEVERINDRTIRVSIHKDDLEGRGIEFLDLLGDHKQVEQFFHSILEELDEVEDFTSSDAVTFQVMPSSDGLDLLITHRDFDEMGQEEEMEHFLEMLQNQSKQLGFFSKEGLSGLEKSQLGKLEEKLDDEKKSSDDEMKRKVQRDLQPESFTCMTTDIEPLLAMARDRLVPEADTSLYALPEMSGYALLVTLNPEYFSPGSAQLVSLLFSEYSQASSLSKEWLDEYGKLLIERDALASLRRTFDKKRK
ncbi:hypothetical protein D3H64_00060 [Atopobacter sp. AH10]|uniref:adaptor protein MecA n=1 Tax=Atopobacter sp. AH10 TaxID=2315861 RepID=UPI000EF21C83|nr:adaptor protein MecA [Atopobacter sp. AH10]RLK64207.1 hypothetical protein D3H64_00060 [Atopobacter sp. AH10]